MKRAIFVASIFLVLALGTWALLERLRAPETSSRVVIGDGVPVQVADLGLVTWRRTLGALLLKSKRWTTEAVVYVSVRQTYRFGTDLTGEAVDVDSVDGVVVGISLPFPVGLSAQTHLGPDFLVIPVNKAAGVSEKAMADEFLRSLDELSAAFAAEMLRDEDLLEMIRLSAAAYFLPFIRQIDATIYRVDIVFRDRVEVEGLEATTAEDRTSARGEEREALRAAFLAGLEVAGQNRATVPSSPQPDQAEGDR